MSLLKPCLTLFASTDGRVIGSNFTVSIGTTSLTNFIPGELSAILQHIVQIWCYVPNNALPGFLYYDHTWKGSPVNPLGHLQIAT